MGLLDSILPIFSGIIKPSWTVYKDISYSEPVACKADLYLLNNGVHPVIIFIHGGGWSSGDKSAYEGRARKYALAGFHVVAINYRLAKFDDPSTQWPAQFTDVKTALRWVRQNSLVWRMDPGRVCVGGDSAGGHLALMLGTIPDKPRAILNMFGPCDLAMPGMEELVCSLPLFDKHTPMQAPDLYASACPLRLMTSTFPPTIIMHGIHDETVPYIQSVVLDKRMTQLGIDHRFIPFDGGHEFAKMSTTTQLDLEMDGLHWMTTKV